MPIDDQAKNNLVINLSSLVRHGHIKVDVQRLSLAFRMTIDDLEDGQAIDLEPLFQYMKGDLSVPEKDALELCIVIASRQEKLGAPFTLPAVAQTLSPDALEQIVEVHNEKRVVSGSWDLKKLVEPEKTPDRKKAWEPEKKKKKSGPSRQVVLASALAMSVVAGVAFKAWLSATAGPPIVTVAAPEDGLPCLTLIMSASTAVCTISTAAYNSMPIETLGAKATLTVSALRTSGIKKVWIKTAENQKVVHIQ